MSTVTPSRPAPPRPASSRTSGTLPSSRAGHIDPFRVLRRHTLAIIAAIFGGAILGVVAFYLLQAYYPLYTGQVVFEIQAGVQEAGDVGTAEVMRDDDVFRKAKTQLVLLTYRPVLEIAAMDPDLQKAKWFQENFTDPSGSPLVAEAVDELEEKLDPSTVRGTDLFQLSWSAHEREDVPKVLHAVYRAYMAEVEGMENEVFNANIEQFRQALNTTNRQIDDLDQEIKDFIRAHDIESLADSRYHHSAAALNEITQQIAQAQSSLNLTMTSYQQTAAKLEGTMEYAPEDILEAEMDYGVVNHVRLLETLKVEIRVLREQYQDDHPIIGKADSRFRATMLEKTAKIEEVIKRNLNARLKAFANDMERFQGAITQMNELADQEGEVLRVLASEQSKYESLRTRRDYLETSRDADLQLIKDIQMMKFRKDASAVRVYQEPITPRELSFPLPEVIIPLGVLLVLSITVGVIFIREITDQRVKSASDLSIIPGANVLGVIPDLEEDPTECAAAELAIRKFPNSVLAESYRQAATPLLKAVQHAGHQTLVLLGGLPGAGTTTAASNLALGYAAAGRKVLLVDANFRRPRLAEVMGVASDQLGLGDLLTEEGSLDEVTHDAGDGVSVVAAGTPANRVIERLNTEKMNSLVAEMRSRYDLVIFDAPPAIVAGDAMVLANKLDAAVLVVRANQEHRGLVSRLISQLGDTRCDLLGILLNRPRGTAGGYFKKNFAAMADYAKNS